jgi:hypothetical protein
MSASNANTEDGQNHPVRIVWDPVTQLFSVYFDCVLRLQTTVDITNSIFGGVNMVNWGFTAGTGGLSNIQSVCLTPDILNASNDVTICPGSSAILTVSGADVAGTFNWSPATDLSSTTAANPTANPIANTTYHVIYTDLCGIISEQDFNVTVAPLIVDAVALSDINCANPVATINSTSNINGVTFNWISSGGSFNTATNASNVGVNSPGFYSVITDYQGVCQAMDTITIAADYSDFQIITGGTQMLNCNNPNGSLSAMVNGFSNVAFNWTTTNGTINGGSTTASINVADAGTYIVNATLNSNCFDTETINVTANFDIPTVNLSCFSGLNCNNPNVSISSATNATTPEYIWTGPGIQSGQNTSSITIDAAGTYALTITDNINGCASSANISVAENFTTPTITIGVQDTLSCLKPLIPIQNVSINNSSDYSLAWSTIEGFLVDGINGINPTVSVAADYTLIATDNASGCTDTQTVLIAESSSSQFDIKSIQYPNILTLSDGDAFNSCWTPFLPGLNQSELFSLISSYELQVFNRWGQLIYEASTPSAFCPKIDEINSGTYFYIIKISSSCAVENDPVKGTFLVK